MKKNEPMKALRKEECMPTITNKHVCSLRRDPPVSVVLKREDHISRPWCSKMKLHCKLIVGL
jgi:hypothetical protein